MGLFGIYGHHPVEACPLNNIKSRKMVLNQPPDLESFIKKYKINKFLGRYHSALEHTFLWIADAEDPHLIQKFAIDSGLASWNAVKIVPLINFQDVMEMMKEIGAD
ncbi:MAG: DUF3303 family protein [Candidatus Deferrimicrobiaceae bacterium]